MRQPNRSLVWHQHYQEVFSKLNFDDFDSEQDMEDEASHQASVYTEEYLDGWGDYMYERAKDERYGL